MSKKSRLNRILSDLAARPRIPTGIPHPVRDRPSQRRLGPSWWWLNSNSMMVLTLPTPGAR